jgi:hypothetical protein
MRPKSAIPLVPLVPLVPQRSPLSMYVKERKEKRDNDVAAGTCFCKCARDAGFWRSHNSLAVDCR